MIANLTGGIVEKGVAKNGGNIGLYGTLNIQDNAIIREGVAALNGGNISIYANGSSVKCVVNMTGGSIENGSAKDFGNVRIQGKDGTVDFNMTGGSISGGQCTNGYPSVGLTAPSGTGRMTLTVGGTAKIDAVQCAVGAQFLVSQETPLTGEAGVEAVTLCSGSTTLTAGAVVSSVVDAAAAARFQSGDDAWKLVYDSAAKILSFVEK